MLFSSLVFLLLFLPLFFIIYFTAKKRRTRNIVLLIFSLFFYAWGEPIYVFLMILTIIVNYFLAIGIEQKHIREDNKSAKALVILAVSINIASLIVFKYTGFFVDIFNSIKGGEPIPIPKIVLPIGISFYTFQTLSYVIDVYRREIPAQRDILFLGTYVSGFPQLVAGPVVRYETIAQELVGREETISDFAAGMRRFITGLGKKVLIANTMAMVVDTIFRDFIAAEYGAVGAWIAMIAYTIQIYFDFSGYSDMAIGMGRMMGFHYLENFNYPYIAKSITDFWRRWHISMSTFFRDYVYIPLGGNRVSQARWIFNIAVVWACTGFWHGAEWTFILWGVYFGFILIIEKLFLGKALEKLPVVKNIYALFLIVIGWVIFRAQNLSHMLEILKAMFGGYGVGGNEDIPLAQILLESGCGIIFFAVLAIAIIASMPTSRFLKEKLSRYKYGPLVMDVGVLILLVVCVIELSLNTYNPFIYFEF